MPTPRTRDDLVHEPRNERGWRESYYFSFFDDRLGLGGFSSIGRRPASGHTGSINVLWGPDRPTLIASEYDKAARHDDDHLVHGLHYAAREPFGPWDISFAGRLNDGGSDVECDHAALTTTAAAHVPKRDVAYDLTFAPDAPPYLYEEADHWRRLFDGHIDEVGRVTGTVTVEGETFVVDARGAKDHSWGVRDWYGVQAWRWMDVVCADGPELALWRGSFDGESWFGDGAVYARGATAAIKQYGETITHVPRAEKEQPSAIEVEVGAGDGGISFSGEAVRVVPIFFSREHDGMREVSWNDRVLMRCTTGDGARAWANVEFEARLSSPVAATAERVGA